MSKRILCFGDSNTWGANPTGDGTRHPPHIRWTGVLAGKLGPDFTLVEEGFNGRTSVWDDPIEGKMSGLRYLVPCLASHAPLDLVVLMLGTNDTKERFGCGPETIAYGMRRLIASVSAMDNATHPLPQVLLVSPIRISDDYRKTFLLEVLGEGCVAKSQGFASAYRKVAEDTGCHFFDAATVAQPSSLDGCHMDPESHAALAAGLYGCIREIFPSDSATKEESL